MCSLPHYGVLAGHAITLKIDYIDSPALSLIVVYFAGKFAACWTQSAQKLDSEATCCSDTKEEAAYRRHLTAFHYCSVLSPSKPGRTISPTIVDCDPVGYAVVLLPVHTTTLQRLDSGQDAVYTPTKTRPVDDISRPLVQ